MVLSAFVFAGSVRAQGLSNLAGCAANSTCWENCIARNSEEFISEFSAWNNYHAKLTCIQQCFLDPASGWNIFTAFPQCDGTTARLEGWDSMHYRDWNTTVENSTYICGDCSMPAGYGPSGLWEMEVFSRAPNGWIGGACEDCSEEEEGHTWHVTLDFNPNNYTVDVNISLADGISIGSELNFDFECKDEPYKLTYAAEGIAIMFIHDGVPYSECMRKNLAAYYITLHRPVWTNYNEMSFRFTREVPTGWVNDDLHPTFFSVPDVIYDYLTPPTQAPTPSPTRALKTGTGLLHETTKKIYVVVFACLFALTLVALLCAHRRDPKTGRGEYQKPLLAAGPFESRGIKMRSQYKPSLDLKKINKDLIAARLFEGDSEQIEGYPIIINSGLMNHS